MNLGGGVYSELTLCHCTPAWATEQDSLSLKEKKKKVINPIYTDKETENQEDQEMCPNLT